MRYATQQALVSEEPDIDYPETDGKPMADTDTQRKPLTYLVEALDYHFQNQPNVYVSGDLLIYYEKGSPKKVAPDVFVVFGVPKYDRKIYQTWAERKTPDVVIEIASPSTYQKDEKEKPELYQRLSVQEYFQYDPTGNYLPQPLRGRTLDDKGHYQALPTETLKDGSKIITSRILGLELRLEKYQLRVFDPLTEEYLFTYSEEAKGRRQAQKEARHERKRKEWAQREALLERQRADQEQQQKELAQREALLERQRADQEQQQKELAQREALLERQRAEQAQLKVEQERQKAEQERQKGEQERQKAEQERQRAEQAQLKAEQERQKAEQELQQKELAQQEALLERQRAEQERQRANKLAEQLRALGINLDEID
jgi:Uma2 family endonuclease